jgi:hypothetical protein
MELGRHIDYPPTPDLAGRVRLSLATRPQPTGCWRRLLETPRRLAIATALLVLIALTGVLALSPQARTAVAERLGLRGVPIEQVSRLPTLPPATPPGDGLDLGTPTTLADASARLPLLTPTAPELGEPDAVYVAPTALGGTVALVYGARPGLALAPETGVSVLLLESRLPAGAFQPAVLGKTAGPDTRLEELSVNGGRGVWLEGAPHLLFLPDASGQFREDRVRLAANVLVWEQGGLLVRLEGAFSRDQALRLAASLR